MPTQRKLSGKIIGGTRSQSGQFPYTVSIKANNGSATSSSFCGGSVIGQTWILTAAHCTRGYTTFEVGVGSMVLQTPIMKIFVSSAIEHPDFNPKNLNNDIALIKIPELPVNAPTIGHVLLPKYSQEKHPFLNAKVTVSGYGRTADKSNVNPFLDYVELKVIPNKACSAIYGEKIVTENVICAKDANDPNHNACIGGMLIIKIRKFKSIT